MPLRGDHTTERRTQPTFCRICSATCGLIATVANGEVTRVVGDREHPLSAGYACHKGLNSFRHATSPDRILRPLVRDPEGGFRTVTAEEAVDFAASRLRTILERDGPDAIALFGGTQGYFNSAGAILAPAFAQALGTTSFFSPWTIDQSAKTVTAGRLGSWSAGRHRWETADTWMIVGSNPLVSVTSGAGNSSWHVTRSFQQARRRGMKLIVIDPRRTETAAYAALHLQPRPGQDAAIIACLLREIISRGLHDSDFCARYVDGFDELRRGVEPFTPALVADRAGLESADLVRAAEMFAGATRGCAGTSTGATMSVRSNLTDHLVECLNVITGRFLRAGETVTNPGVTTPASPRRAEVVAPGRPWDSVPRTRVRGLGRIPSVYGGMELPCAVMAEGILTPGDGQIRAMLSIGRNPVAAVPGRRSIERAFKSLELLICVVPFHTATTRYADVVFPSRLQFERADLSMTAGRSSVPFAQYTEPVDEAPPDSELIDDAEVLWALARALGIELRVNDAELTSAATPSTETVLRAATVGAQVPFSDVAEHAHGHIFDVPSQIVEPGRGTARFSVLPEDVGRELSELVEEEPEPHGDNEFSLIVRRMREAANSVGAGREWTETRAPTSPVSLHPADLRALGVDAGGPVTIRSRHGSVVAVTAQDATLRRGVASLTHAWDLPNGADSNTLTTVGSDYPDHQWDAVDVGTEGHDRGQ
ncbi:molybdopterin-dependent oxidoreductase [Gordonia sp. SCSIO 19800]|uniref:molybdopterin-containing oxidoreductase family protein n=1 Tax=Gordonia sp. SCSIO 19800 TaxID=2826926 RepID=UPI002013A7E9|nr:molybdopterin-dependent oxidoreductase [Gordonia sp. SCSIO 19800]